MLEGIIQGAIVHGGISIADKIKQKVLEKKIRNESNNIKNYYKLIRIYYKNPKKMDDIIRLSNKLIEIFPESSFAWVNLSIQGILKFSLIDKKNMEFEEIVEMSEFEELRRLFNKTLEIIGMNKENELTIFELELFMNLHKKIIY